jgi:anion-transporting  ArsA/GET3 family ATPase
MLDNRIFRMLMLPTRTTLRVGSMAAQAFLHTVARVVGSDAVDDVIAFFRAFEGMEQGFRDRAAEVARLLASPDTAFVLVTSPRRDAIEEASFFAQRLADSAFTVDALVVNRVHPHFCDVAASALRARAAELVGEHTGDDPGSGAARRLAAAYANLADFEEIATRERREVAGLATHLGGASVVYVPELGHDVHNFTALRTVSGHLVAGG